MRVAEEVVDFERGDGGEGFADGVAGAAAAFRAVAPTPVVGRVLHGQGGEVHGREL